MAKIRLLSLRDIPEAAAILDQEQGFCVLDKEAASSKQVLEGMLESRRVHVMEMGSALAGVASFIPEPVLAGGGCIQFLVIRKKLRHEGIGRQFIGFIERKIFVNCRSVFLSVSFHNESARFFFESLGYSRTGELADRSEWILRKDRQPGCKSS
jgi:ribosomal protein S18 acetylase RimI-like enzyme